MCTHSHPAHGALCFIIPPHILEYIAAHSADVALRQNAVRSLQLHATLRGMREGFAQLASAGPGTTTRQRTIYNAREKMRLPGIVERTEGQGAVADLACNEAYDGSGLTYDFYKDILHRRSIDNHGMRLDSTVHYGHAYDNAFWNGRQMVYGDGDGVLFDRFTKCIDVIGHELTHGVTQFSAQLEYQDQPGALNESMSDVFGSLIKQYQFKQTAEQADWLIGAGLFIPKDGVNRMALRSMKAPGTAYDDPAEIGKDPQPAHMRDYYQGSDDNGGVHINSGIPNHAFYLAATGIGGYAWEVAGRIWYETLTTRLQASSDFADMAAESRHVAQHYPGNAAQAVDAAWTAVGL